MTPERLTHLPPVSGWSGGTKCMVPSLSVVAAPFSLVLSVAVTLCLHCPPHPQHFEAGDTFILSSQGWGKKKSSERLRDLPSVTQQMTDKVRAGPVKLSGVSYACP